MTQASTTFEGVTALVTGGAGAIGTHLVDALLGQRAQVVVLDDFSAPALPEICDRNGLRVVRGDVRDNRAIEAAFAGGVDFVFHLAALFANQRSIESPQDDLLINGLGTLKILHQAALRGVRRVVYASSSTIYGRADALPMEEHMPSLSPGSPYHVTKLLGELYAKYFNDHVSLSTASVRIFNAYGPGEVPGRYRNVVPNFIWLALNGRPLEIMGTGQETRDFTYVEDVIRGLMSAAHAKDARGTAINLGTGHETTVQSLAEQIVAATGSTSTIEYRPRRGWDFVVRRRASIERARRVLGYEPEWSLADGIHRTVAWFRAHEAELEERLTEVRP